MKIAIFGGSFDPVHRGHEGIVLCALERADKLIVIPNNVSPFKTLRTEGKHRLQMCKLAFEEMKRAEISCLELEREGVSYTVETLKEIRREYPDDQLFLVLGSDSFLEMNLWHNPKEIAANCTVWVVMRGKAKKDSLKESIQNWRTEYLGDIEIIGRCDEISATDTRIDYEFLGRSKSVRPSINDYIVENKLYNNYERFIESLRKHLTDKEKVKHTINVCKTALRLAKRWGESADKAMMAALLHDIGKNIDSQKAVKLGLSLQGDLSSIHPKCRHGYIGAAIASEELGIVDEDILNAIRYHTTGRANMSLLEKITALADYIEPDRDFTGIEKLRRLAFEDLDESVLTMLKKTIRFLERKNAEIDPKSYEAFEWIKKVVSERK